MPSTTANQQDATGTPQPGDTPRLELPSAELPRHVAVIMDGNGRWAQQRGQDRTFGHRKGAEAVRAVVTESAKLGLDVLTLYSFSTENWTRSQSEVAFLMNLYVEYLVRERETLAENNVRFIQIGRREGLPTPVLHEMDQVIEATSKNTGLTLALALNYGSRAEITDAVRAIARKVAAGELSPDAIEDTTISNHLYTAGLPDPDLLIRTAGEMRLSNYLLWQISYAEFYVADVCWPDFQVEAYHKALRAYAKRQRKFGAVV
ncbi:isoprenyl transferase [Phycisphaerales bacterium AB-hyl4]|uniref:Isoprenyl transferase n=1 Tax=Natronomicrosphaera hydrolytica TaxID=3242702 RepID=A0ABV4U392_9BACT